MPSAIPYSLFTSRWVFKQLYDKGLVYRGVKVMPFSTACNTPLSNFESHQNYKVSQYMCTLCCNQISLLSSIWIWKALVFFAWWYISILLHSRLIVKIQVNGLVFIIFCCICLDHLILAAFCCLSYCLQTHKVHTLFQSGKLLSLSLWGLKMSIVLC